MLLILKMHENTLSMVEKGTGNNMLSQNGGMKKENNQCNPLGMCSSFCCGCR
jgi:hypothetical protein